jgi:phage gp46-like protein
MTIRGYDGDIKLQMVNDLGSMFIDSNDLTRDAGLETAILISLFSDRLVTSEENSKETRGWWGDSETNKIGSKLWLLERVKITDDVILRANSYVRDCLKWLIDDGVALKVESIVQKGDGDVMVFTITVYRPLGKGGATVFQYFYNWEAEKLNRV